MSADRINSIARVLLLLVAVGGLALYLFIPDASTPTEVLGAQVTSSTPATTTTAAPTTTTTTTTTSTTTTTTIPVDPADAQEAAVAALAGAGFEGLAVTVEGNVADITGVVPVAALAAGGFFAYEAQVTGVVTAVPGIGSARARLQLRGDEATLRRQLRDLLQATPVVFNPAESALTAESQSVLDQAASIILASPGLRVLVAGHADSTGSSDTNEALSNARAQAALTYLVERGVPANRLSIVAYGELFPTADNSDEAQRSLNRRIDFEVAA